MDERRRIAAKGLIVTPRKPGSQHVFPKVQPAWCLARRDSPEQFTEHAPLRERDPGDDAEKREQFPLVEYDDPLPAKLAAAAPERIQANLRATRTHGDNFTL